MLSDIITSNIILAKHKAIFPPQTETEQHQLTEIFYYAIAYVFLLEICVRAINIYI